MGAVHRQAARDGVALGDQVLYRKVQVGEGRAQHGDQLPKRLRTAVSPGMRLAIQEFGVDQLVRDS
jgi:hypothetical protein